MQSVLLSLTRAIEPVIRRAYQYRLYPTKAQISTLENQFSMCRHLWNWSLTERQERYAQDGTTLRYQDQQNQLPKLKEERPWFKGVHSQVLQDVLRRLENAYQAFFRRVQAGVEDPGYPKLKKRGQWDSITYPQYRQRPSDWMAVPKVGAIRMVLHRQLPPTACGQRVQKSLSTRTHRCACGYGGESGHNAALNILRLGLEMLAGLTA